MGGQRGGGGGVDGDSGGLREVGGRALVGAAVYGGGVMEDGGGVEGRGGSVEVGEGGLPSCEGG